MTRLEDVDPQPEVVFNGALERWGSTPDPDERSGELMIAVAALRVMITGLDAELGRLTAAVRRLEGA